MGLFVRSLLLWLLVLAVPAQGLAAATMVFCGPDHHAGGGQPALALHDTHAEHQHPGHDDQNAPHHPADEQAEAQAEAQEVDDAQAGAQAQAAAPSAAQTRFVHADKHKCSACASCCSAAAILSRAPVLPAPEVTATEFAAVVPTVDPFATDGPDRPPRSRLA